jgi:outer membrane scaffolding protein for murein synthesis (MipA/OmpV family)
MKTNLFSRCTLPLGASIAAAAAAPALAQLPPPPLKVDDSRLTVGIGIAAAPSYEGSNDYVPVPAVLINGKIGPVSVFSRATTFYVDAIGEKSGAKTDILFGPLVNLRIDRANRVRDPVVKRLGKLDTVVELGGFRGDRTGGDAQPL